MSLQVDVMLRLYSGKPEVMKEAFYIVEEVINKGRYDLQQMEHMKGALNGTFHHIKNHYFYLNARLSGKSEAEARKQFELEDEVHFEISKYLFLLEKHGGRAVMK